jgi:prephenate dehydrogenase
VLAGRLPPGATLGPGARDATRLAASEPALWTEIFLMNRDFLLPELRALREPLAELEAALAAGDAPAVQRWLDAGARWRRGIDS